MKELSDTAILQEMGKRIRETRTRLNFRQEDLSIKSGVSLTSVAKVESGKPVSVTILLPILRTLQLLDGLETLIPEPEISPIQLRKFKKKTIKRVRIK